MRFHLKEINYKWNVLVLMLCFGWAFLFFFFDCLVVFVLFNSAPSELTYAVSFKCVMKISLRCVLQVVLLSVFSVVQVEAVEVDVDQENWRLWARKETAFMCTVGSCSLFPVWTLMP